ncbi:MAG: 16S rRNA (cytosine(967)-C(5))-methyltransferase [Cyanobacteriota bacterium]
MTTPAIPAHPASADAAHPTPEGQTPEGQTPEGLSPAGLTARLAAWQVLLAVAGGAYADAALERELQRTALQPADRGLVTELAYGAIRQRALLDAWLDAVGKVPADRQPPRLRWLLHLGLYQLLFCSRVPAAAAVSTTVELAKGGGLGRLAPVANAILRAVLRRRQPLAARAVSGGIGDAISGGISTLTLEPWQGLELPAAPAAALALRRSLPLGLAQLLLQWRPAERAEAFARACNQAPPLDLRVNPLRTTREQALAALRAAGVEAAPLPDLSCGIELRGRSGDLRRLPGFASGHWCVQDRAAQRIAPLLAPQPGHWVLDACAAPGGKATHLAELMGAQGTVWAVDRSAARLQRLRRNAERLGLTGLHSLTAEAEHLPQLRPDWIGRFDRILLDAPCSGLGTLARHADARWRLTPETVAELTALQRQLLEGILPLLALRGRLVYATCTVHPAENADLISAFIAQHPELQWLASTQSWPGEGQGGDGFYTATIACTAG